MSRPVDGESCNAGCWLLVLLWFLKPERRGENYFRSRLSQLDYTKYRRSAKFDTVVDTGNADLHPSISQVAMECTG